MIIFIISIICIAVGAVLVIKTDWFIEFFGRVMWAELHFGGTKTFYKALGVFIIFLSFMLMTGFLQSFIKWFFRLGSIG